MHAIEAAGARTRTASTTTLLFLYAALVLPSLFIVQKFIGSAGASAYAAFVALLVVGWRHVPPPGSARRELLLALALVAAVIVVFVWFFPRVNVHLPLQGSDDDDAYDLGARALLSGRSPYAERTYLGNVLHQFAGAFILAIPFVLMGTSALQNVFWLPLFFVAARTEIRDGRAVHLAALALVASPVILYHVATGTGHCANAIYAALGLWWLIRTERHRDAASVAWGVALASRANFVFLLPFAFAWVRKRFGLTAAARSAALTTVTIALLTAPFYLSRPSDYGPLEASNRLTRFDALLPHAGVVLIFVMGLLALWLAARAVNVAELFRNAAIVQAFPVVAGTVLGAIQWQTIDLVYLEYLVFALWFALMGFLAAERPVALEAEPATRLPGRQ
jgi:hypothetical protein